MRGLDDTDREILRLLLADARRPYSDIAEQVDLSAPAVSDRVERLREQGLIRRFTLDVDREMLDRGAPVLVTIRAEPGRGSALADTLVEADPIEHVFRTADDRLVATATIADADGALSEWLDPDAVQQYDEADLAPACDECGNTVTVEGESERLDGDVYHFCCESCRGAFVDRYERMRERA